MKKVMKKRVKRFEGGGSAEDEFGPTGNSSSGGTDIYAAARKRDEDKENSDAYEAMIQKLSKDSDSGASKVTEQGLGPSFKRPEFVEGRDYTVAPSPVKPALVKIDPEKAKAIAKAKILKDELLGASSSSAKQSDNLAVKSRADAALKRRIAQTKAQEAGGMEYHPELYLNPGRIGTKAVMEAAQALARGKGAKAAFERVEPYMESVAPYLKEIGHSALKVGREFPKLGMKRGGAVKKMSSGGSTSKSSASSRGDGIASKGKTRGRIC
jgi:hypothetical protein